MTSNPNQQAIETPELQRSFWNEWNASVREQKPLDEPSLARGAFALDAVRRYLDKSARIVELGCGTGWTAERLATVVGHVTAVDLADEVIARAVARSPHIRFLAGDAMTQPPDDAYDAVVCIETFSHVPDQRAFLARVSALLRPGGWLFLTTQNRRAFEHASGVMSQAPGQIRRWVTPEELRTLASNQFRVEELTTMLPLGDRGWYRFVNGRKACAVWNRLAGVKRWRAIRERLGFGQTITLVARKL
jgi:2-polyprenyl-3-methyl-5-hydroxy-6-metoxy-1,4-benzoquinol methylase